jgi:hypothetical protein
MIKRLVFWFFLVVPFLCTAQERQALKPKAISKLLPVRIQGYNVMSDSKSTTITIGTLRYALCERTFSHRNQTIKILLFDYAEAPVMLNQSVKKWDEMPPMQTDSVSFSKYNTAYGEIWESAHPRSNRSQILASINNRFFLTLEAEKMTLEELKEFFKNIDLSKFPD